MSSKRVRIFFSILTFVLRNFGIQIVYFLYLYNSASSGESCTGGLGDSVAAMVAHPAIGGISLGAKKYTTSRFHDR